MIPTTCDEQLVILDDAGSSTRPSPFHGMNIRRLSIAPVLFVLCFLAPVLRAQEALRLPWVFSDHMVLQRGRPVPVWGTAAPGERIRVDFDDVHRVALADEEGRWRIDLAPLAASTTGRTLTIAGTTSAAVFDDVLVGEVWLCAGQSNMEFPLEKAATGMKARRSAKLPLVRLCDRIGYPGGARRRFSPHDLELIASGEYFSGAWERCTPEMASGFSAVGFFFGRELAEVLEIPIGLIDVSVGGSSTEGWVPEELLRADPVLAPLARDFLATHLTHPFLRERTLHHLRDWERAGRPDPRPRHFYEPGFLYDEAIATLAPFALRGALWYQGESNAHLPRIADRLFRLLVPAWRKAWEDPALPLLFVQLPGLNRPTWPEFREVQAGWQDIPNVHMAVAIDLGEADDVHPRHKLAVGQRLARLALAHAYDKAITYCGPEPGAVERDGATLLVNFAPHQEQPCDNRPYFLPGRGAVGFEVAGADRRFHTARAKLRGFQLRLSSPAVPEPLWARYAWSPFPTWSLVNAKGLPAAPFRTHDWRPVRVACIGDSITAGFGLEHPTRDAWPARLQELLGDGFDVRNFGNSGASVVQTATRDDGSPRAYSLQPEHQDALLFEPEVVICNLGINDIVEWREKGARFVADYLALLDAYRRLPSRPKLLVWGPLSPLFPGQEFHGSPDEAAIHDAIAQVARQAGAAAVDLHAPLVDHPEWYPDHLHPNAEGAAAIALLVREAMTHLDLAFAPPPLR